MRKIFLVLIPIILLLLLAIWSPWVRWNIDIRTFFGLSPVNLTSGIQVYSLAGTLEIYLDGVKLGEAVSGKDPFITDKIESGQKVLSLKRVSSNESVKYWEINRLINFQPSTTVIASFNLGPDEIFSEGNIIYVENRVDDLNPEVKIKVNVPEALVTLEDITIQKINSNNFIGRMLYDKSRKIVVIKEGYETSEFFILPESEQDRDSLKQYNFNIEVFLMYKPFLVE